MKIAVAGTGYVGLSIATLLSQHHEVMAVDIIPEKVDLINQRKSPIQDEYIEKYLAEKDLNLTDDERLIYKNLSKTMLKPISEIVSHVPFGKSKTTDILKSMIKKGAVKVEGRGRGTKYILK